MKETATRTARIEAATNVTIIMPITGPGPIVSIEPEEPCKISSGALSSDASADGAKSPIVTANEAIRSVAMQRL